MQGRLKLLDNFEGLLERPILQDELEKKYNVLISQYKDDGLETQNIFQDNKQPVSSNEDDAPIFQNMPPVTGSVYWANSLRQRLREPMVKIRAYADAVREVPEDFREVEKLFASKPTHGAGSAKSKPADPTFDKDGARVGKDIADEPVHSLLGRPGGIDECAHG